MVTPDEEATSDFESRPIRISGTEEAITAAHQLISEIVDARPHRPAHAGPQSGLGLNGQPLVVEVLTVSNEKVGLIICKRKAAIRAL